MAVVNLGEGMFNIERYLWSLFICIGVALSLHAQPSGATTYSVSDTMPYSNGPTSGQLAHLFYNGNFVDSIDVWFGVQSIGCDTVAFATIASTDPRSKEADIQAYVLFDGNERRYLETLVPHFHNYFSSPTVLASSLYYWGIDVEQMFRAPRIYAIRYEFSSGRIDSVLLEYGLHGTDNRSYLHPPEAVQENVLYEREGKWWLLDRESFKILLTDTTDTLPP